MNNYVYIWGDWLSCHPLRGSHDSQSPHIWVWLAIMWPTQMVTWYPITPYKETLVPRLVATLIYLSQTYSYYIRGDRSPLASPITTSPGLTYTVHYEIIEYALVCIIVCWHDCENIARIPSYNGLQLKTTMIESWLHFNLETFIQLWPLKCNFKSFKFSKVCLANATHNLESGKITLFFYF